MVKKRREVTVRWGWGWNAGEDCLWAAAWGDILREWCLSPRKSGWHALSLLLFSSLPGSQPCHGKGPAVTQGSPGPRRATQVGRVTGKSSAKRGPLEEGRANHSSFLDTRIPWSAVKRQEDKTLDDEPLQGGRCPICYREERRAVANSSRKTEAAGPRGNDAQSWMRLGLKVKSDAVKNGIFVGTWNVRSMLRLS